MANFYKFVVFPTAKAFLSFLSEGLSIEYESKGIYIQTVNPGQVSTKLTENVRVPILAVTPEDFVKAAIKTVGIEHYTSGHWKHKLLGYLSRLAKCFFTRRFFMRSALSSISTMRQKYYQKHNLADD